MRHTQIEAVLQIPSLPLIKPTNCSNLSLVLVSSSSTRQPAQLSPEKHSASSAKASPLLSQPSPVRVVEEPDTSPRRYQEGIARRVWGKEPTHALLATVIVYHSGPFVAVIAATVPAPTSGCSSSDPFAVFLVMELVSARRLQGIVMLSAAHAEASGRFVCGIL